MHNAFNYNERTAFIFTVWKALLAVASALPVILTLDLRFSVNDMLPMVTVAGIIGSMTCFFQLFALISYSIATRSPENTKNNYRWDVKLNGLHLGILTDRDFSGIRLEVLLNRQNHIDQTVLIAKDALRSLMWYLLFVPLALLSILLVTWLCREIQTAPQIFNIWQANQGQGTYGAGTSFHLIPNEVWHLAGSLIRLCIGFSVARLLFFRPNVVHKPYTWQWTCFADATAIAIKHHFNQPTEAAGEVKLLLVTQEGRPVLSEQYGQIKEHTY